VRPAAARRSARPRRPALAVRVRSLSFTADPPWPPNRAFASSAGATCRRRPSPTSSRAA
jgi:hypothetical protein